MKTHTITPQGPGSVSGAPYLPAGFTDTFTSHFVDTGDVRLRAVIGGEDPPLLPIHGWPGRGSLRPTRWTSRTRARPASGTSRSTSRRR
jgi:hypothetical protein